MELNVGRNAAWLSRTAFQEQFGTGLADSESSLLFLYVGYNDTTSALDLASPEQSALRVTSGQFCQVVSGALNNAALTTLSLQPTCSVVTRPAIPRVVHASRSGTVRTGDRIDIIVEFDVALDILARPHCCSTMQQWQVLLASLVIRAILLLLHIWWLLGMTLQSWMLLGAKEAFASGIVPLLPHHLVYPLMTRCVLAQLGTPVAHAKGLYFHRTISVPSIRL